MGKPLLFIATQAEGLETVLTPSPQASNLLTSLIAYWKLGEVTGEVRADSAGGNSLTPTGGANPGPSQVAGKIGNAASFTSANSEYLNIADNPDLSTGDIDFTMSVWIWLTTNVADMVFFTKGTADNAAGLEHRLIYNQAIDRLRWLTSNGLVTAPVNADAFGSPPMGQWIFVVCWHDSINNTTNIQVNNGTVNSVADTGGQDIAGNFRLGASASTTAFLNGRMDEFGFWKRVLTTAERTALYNNGLGCTYNFQACVPVNVPQTSEINLLDTRAVYCGDGWIPKIAQQKSGGLYSESALADGSELVIESLSNVVEEMPLYIRGKDPDQIAAATHLIFDMGQKLRQYWVNNIRQQAPVYLGYRPKDQTNIQYTLLKNYRIESETEAFGHSFKGFIGKPATFVGTLFLEREPFWRDRIPGVLPAPLLINHPSAPNPATLQSVADYRNSFTITHIYNYDDSTATFSANLVNNADFTYFPSPAGDADIVYFGSTAGPFFNIVHNIGTTGSFEITVAWQIWNGAIWTSAGSASRLFSGSDSPSGKTGKSITRIDAPGTWSRTTVNGVNAYWIRALITSFTSMATNPTNADELAYAANKEYVEIDGNDLNGDLESLLRMYLYNHAGSGGNTIYSNAVIVGAKSRGLASFTSRLNWSGFDNPLPWLATLGTGAIVSQDGRSPSGERVGISFATTTNQRRATLRMSSGNESYGADWFGEYQVFVLCHQVGGAVGDVIFQLFFNLANGIIGGQIGKRVSPQRVGTNIEIIDCGRLKIPPDGTNLIDTSHRIGIELYAESLNPTPQLFIYQVVLIPIDEYASEFRDPIVLADSRFGSIDPSGSALIDITRLSVDSGVIREECSLSLAASSVSGQDASEDNYGYIMSWEARGRLPRLVPKRTTRLYFLFGEYPTGSASGSMIWNTGNGGLINIFSHNLYQYLRGEQ